MSDIHVFPALAATLATARALPIAEARRPVLAELAYYVTQRLAEGQMPQLHFICTHNSRRSQLSQVWGQALAALHGLPLACFSGGTEATAFNPRAVAALERAGFRVSTLSGGENPRYQLHFAEGAAPVLAFSKTYDEAPKPEGPFAAVMTCAEADENCPFIPGAQRRIPLRYEDPKAFDGTPSEAAKYSERSLQIAAELDWAFGQVTKNLSAR